jgi:uncharacterized protein
VQRELSAMDASHDYAHICRVRNLALSLAKDEHIEDAATLQGSVKGRSHHVCVIGCVRWWFTVVRVWDGCACGAVIELAALLHDLKDWKYSGSETAGSDCARAFLETAGSDSPELIERVCYVITHMGFKTELGQHGSIAITPELAIVQDADRLDAIGAIGIFMFLLFVCASILASTYV